MILYRKDDNNEKIFIKQWVKATAVRAVKTVAQTVTGWNDSEFEEF